MLDFSKRNVQRSKTLGERLKKVREESGISLDESERATGIQKKYLLAIENGDYPVLPSPVYVESFLKKYANFLKVSEDFVLELYRQQEKKVLKKKYQPTFSATKQKMPRAVITPKLVRKIVIYLVICACLMYVGFEVLKIFLPPNLMVDNPQDFITVHQSTVEVSGSTDSEASLTINGREVFLDTQGNFSESVNLNEGWNDINISAVKKRSKSIDVLRHVLHKKNGFYE